MGAPCAALLTITVRVMSSCHVTDGHADSLLYGVYVGVCVVYYLVMRYLAHYVQIFV